MKALCELCETGESSILGATSRQIAIGEKCYSRLLENNATWSPETSLRELRELLLAKRPIGKAPPGEVVEA